MAIRYCNSVTNCVTNYKVGGYMGEIYTTYKCKGCNKTIILLTDEVKTTKKLNKFISCSHCGCRKLTKESPVNDLREIMKARSYRRNKHGAIEEVR